MCCSVKVGALQWWDRLFKSHQLPYWLSEVEICTVLIKNIVEDKLQRKLKERKKEKPEKNQ
jgi:hypothetical protein